MMLDNGTVWRQVLSEPTADNPVKPEWHWDGYSALDDSKGPFLMTSSWTTRLLFCN